MAFDLRTNNASGFAVIDQPAGVLATQEISFLSMTMLLSINQNWLLNYITKMVLVKLLNFFEINSKDSYAADSVEHGNWKTIIS
jgi:hypothetical protein